MNICTIPFVMLIILAIAGMGISIRDLQSSPNYKYTRVQSKEDIRHCGRGPLSYTNEWCVQWNAPAHFFQRSKP